MISFFQDKTYVVGADYSYIPEHNEEGPGGEIIAIPEKGRQDCVFVADIEIPAGKLPVLVEENGEYSVEFIEEPKQEISITPEDTHLRIKNLLITAEDPTKVDTEGEKFESELGDIIVARFYNGDRDAETAYIKKWLRLSKKVADGIATDTDHVELQMIQDGDARIEQFKAFIKSL